MIRVLFYKIKAVNGKESNGILRYDPSTQQILIHQNDGLYCLKSTQQGVKNLDAAYVDFVLCSDKYASGFVPTNLRWKIISSASGNGDNKEYQILIEDYDGNVSGIDNLIFGFTIKRDKIGKLSELRTPIYNFYDKGENFGYQGYIGSNYIGTIPQEFCPAPGVFKGNEGRCCLNQS